MVTLRKFNKFYLFLNFMTLSKRLRDGLSSIIFEGLRAENSALLKDSNLLKNSGLVLARKGDSYLLILPVYNSDNEYGKNIAGEITKRLKKYSPVETNFNGFLAYELKLGIKERFPRLLEIEVPATIALNFKVERVDYDLINGISIRQRKLRSATEPLEELAEYYIPNIEVGEKLDISLHNPTCFKYNLIPVRKEHNEKFPGYQVSFRILYGNDLSIETYRTSRKPDTKIGENKGNFITKNIKMIYTNLLNIKEQQRITLELKEKGNQGRNLVYRVIESKS